ncbi:MAG: hypothetical protein CMM02_00285 [Rhodopirellula sp.]|nr:hypothetical protein [Rhodopirellula sp.]
MVELEIRVTNSAALKKKQSLRTHGPNMWYDRVIDEQTLTPPAQTTAPRPSPPGTQTKDDRGTPPPSTAVSSDWSFEDACEHFVSGIRELCSLSPQLKDRHAFDWDDVRKKFPFALSSELVRGIGVDACVDLAIEILTHFDSSPTVTARVRSLRCALVRMAELHPRTIFPEVSTEYDFDEGYGTIVHYQTEFRRLCMTSREDAFDWSRLLDEHLSFFADDFEEHASMFRRMLTVCASSPWTIARVRHLQYVLLVAKKNQFIDDAENFPLVDERLALIDDEDHDGFDKFVKKASLPLIGAWNEWSLEEACAHFVFGIRELCSDTKVRKDSRFDWADLLKKFPLAPAVHVVSALGLDRCTDTLLRIRDVVDLPRLEVQSKMNSLQNALARIKELEYWKLLIEKDDECEDGKDLYHSFGVEMRRLCISLPPSQFSAYNLLNDFSAADPGGSARAFGFDTSVRVLHRIRSVFESLLSVRHHARMLQEILVDIRLKELGMDPDNESMHAYDLRKSVKTAVFLPAPSKEATRKEVATVATETTPASTRTMATQTREQTPAPAHRPAPNAAPKAAPIVAPKAAPNAAPNPASARAPNAPAHRAVPKAAPNPAPNPVSARAPNAPAHRAAPKAPPAPKAVLNAAPKASVFTAADGSRVKRAFCETTEECISDDEEHAQCKALPSEHEPDSDYPHDEDDENEKASVVAPPCKKAARRPMAYTREQTAAKTQIEARARSTGIVLTSRNSVSGFLGVKYDASRDNHGLPAYQHSGTFYSTAEEAAFARAVQQQASHTASGKKTVVQGYVVDVDGEAPENPSAPTRRRTMIAESDED